MLTPTACLLFTFFTHLEFVLYFMIFVFILLFILKCIVISSLKTISSTRTRCVHSSPLNKVFWSFLIARSCGGGTSELVRYQMIYLCCKGCFSRSLIARALRQRQRLANQLIFSQSLTGGTKAFDFWEIINCLRASLILITNGVMRNKRNNLKGTRRIEAPISLPKVCVISSFVLTRAWASYILLI